MVPVFQQVLIISPEFLFRLERRDEISDFSVSITTSSDEKDASNFLV